MINSKKWIFIYNPLFYNFQNASSDPECQSKDYWYYYSYNGDKKRARGNAKLVNQGDEFLLWESGKNRGFVASGYVEEGHRELTIPRQYAQYDRQLQEGRIPNPACVFTVKYSKILNDRVTYDRLKEAVGINNDILSKASRQATYVPLSDDEWNFIIEKFPKLVN